MNRTLKAAMQNSDNLVVELEYRDKKGNKTRRIVSPIRFLSKERFLGLCLCREEPRQFYLKRCENVALRPAHEYQMPVAMVAV